MRGVAVLRALAPIAAALCLTAAGSHPAEASTTWKVAGDGASCNRPGAPCGDGGPATAAQLSSPQGLAVDERGNVYVADSVDHRIRRIDPAGIITTIAGTGVPCPDPGAACGDGGPATGAQLNEPYGVAVDAAGDVYVADRGDHRIRRISAAGTITTVAGSGAGCFPGTAPCGDGGPATAAGLGLANAVAVAPDGDIFIADAGADRIRRVDAGGTITTIAGTGVPCALSAAAGECGDGGPATSAYLDTPSGVAADAADNVFIADAGDNRIRRVDRAGVITTVVGSGEPCAPPGGRCGEGGRPTLAKLFFPSAVARDAAGALYVADTGDERIVAATGGKLVTVAEGVSAPAAVAVDAGGRSVFVALVFDRVIRRLAVPASARPGASSGRTRVTCRALESGTRRRAAVKCKVVLVAPPGTRVLSARLSRGGTVYARARTRARAGRRSIRLRVAGRLASGRYVVTTSVTGKHGRISRARRVVKL